jgi:hypothetical protein
MAFGMMTKKWGILWQPLTIALPKIHFLVECIGRLHNFVITERVLLARTCGLYNVDPVAEAHIEMRGTFKKTLQELLAELEALSDEFPGFSGKREAMVKSIQRLGLHRSKLA